ncbi:hypothetical protein AAG570_010237 [Ranatra chinensis]|uniref:Uncharacterized protein n=1 Tax=Ranatra chinensis TaxID=642074 RepID=A0ABD0YM63_9HEMI
MESQMAKSGPPQLTVVTVEAAGVATAKLAVIEELLGEAVMSELPEKLRRQLKSLADANFCVLLTQVDEEEDDCQAAKEGETGEQHRVSLRCWECGSTHLQAGSTGDRP